MAVIKRHCDGSTAVLVQACWALGYIANDTINRVECGAVGGAEALVNVLTRHGDRPVLMLEQALWAIQSFVYSNADNKIRCGLAGGVVALVDLIDQHSSNA